jgi:hypothetical protein
MRAPTVKLKVGWRLCATTLAVSILALMIPTAAGATNWTQPANEQESYWSPGPPPGNSNANECYVTTENGIAYGAPYGEIYPLDGYSSYCQEAAVELYWTINGNYYEKGPQYVYSPNQWDTLFGGSGGAVVAVDYCSWDTTYIEQCWEASWLG